MSNTQPPIVSRRRWPAVVAAGALALALTIGFAAPASAHTAHAGVTTVCSSDGLTWDATITIGNDFNAAATVVSLAASNGVTVTGLKGAVVAFNGTKTGTATGVPLTLAGFDLTYTVTWADGVTATSTVSIGRPPTCTPTTPPTTPAPTTAPTTVAPTTVAPTTVAPTSVAPTTTPVSPTSVTRPPVTVPPPGLPVTGSSVGLIALLASVFTGVGAVLVRVNRRRPTSA